MTAQRQPFRIPTDCEVVFFWEDPAGPGTSHGRVHSMRTRACDTSDSGMRVESTTLIEPGTRVCVEAPIYEVPIEAVVRYCIPEGAAFRIGIEFLAESSQAPQSAPPMDYYEFMQLSPNADLETIRRVYRIMAARFHPDNPDSGDPQRFMLLTEAYRILSDPALRTQYDQLRETERHRPLPLFRARAFVDEKEGEINRRLGILCLLYAQRKRTPHYPTVTLIELEEIMAIPREHLEFTLWYLKQKKFVEMNQGADFSLTAGGVDFVEEHSPAQNILRLLTNGTSRSAPFAPQPVQ